MIILHIHTLNISLSNWKSRGTRRVMENDSVDVVKRKANVSNGFQTDLAQTYFQVGLKWV